jgi:hypothetical protein
MKQPVFCCRLDGELRNDADENGFRTSDSNNRTRKTKCRCLTSVDYSYPNLMMPVIGYVGKG